MHRLLRAPGLNAVQYGLSDEYIKARQVEADVHLQVGCRLYKKQLAAGRHLINEHPGGARSWKLPCFQDVLAQEGVGRVVGDQCQWADRCVRRTAQEAYGLDVEQQARARSTRPEVPRSIWPVLTPERRPAWVHHGACGWRGRIVPVPSVQGSPQWPALACAVRRRAPGR